LTRRGSDSAESGIGQIEAKAGFAQGAYLEENGATFRCAIFLGFEHVSNAILTIPFLFISA
jgi:hypothetical protein